MRKSKMLAIFDGRVAKRPEGLKLPHKNAVSALKDDFLVNHFTSVYPDSVVVRSKDASTFAYSLGATSTSSLPRFQFALKDNVYCMYQGFIKDFDTVKEDLQLTEIDHEAVFVIRAFQVLRQLGQQVPKNQFQDMTGNCISILYESTSKLVVVARGSNHDHPIFWGIDARFNLVVSNDDSIVEKACASVQPFARGHIFACCEGREGDEAIFPFNKPEFKVLTDKNIPNQQLMESIAALILQADTDRSKPCAEKWEPPGPNFVKVNTDAVVFKDGTIGTGVVVRNSKGVIELASSKRSPNPLPDMDPPIHAFLDGLCLIEVFKIRRCICESVHLDIEKNKKKIGPVLMELMTEKIGGLVKGTLSEFSVSFVSSNANKAARRLALQAKRDDYTVWEKETPECIANIVASERPANTGCTIS